MDAGWDGEALKPVVSALGVEWPDGDGGTDESKRARWWEYGCGPRPGGRPHEGSAAEVRPVAGDWRGNSAGVTCSESCPDRRRAVVAV